MNGREGLVIDIKLPSFGLLWRCRCRSWGCPPVQLKGFFFILWLVGIGVMVKTPALNLMEVRWVILSVFPGLLFLGSALIPFEVPFFQLEISFFDVLIRVAVQIILKMIVVLEVFVTGGIVLGHIQVRVNISIHVEIIKVRVVEASGMGWLLLAGRPRISEEKALRSLVQGLLVHVCLWVATFRLFRFPRARCFWWGSRISRLLRSRCPLG